MASEHSGADLLRDLDFIPLKARGLTQETCKKYGYGISQGRQVAPYFEESGRVCAQKVRGKDKQFHWTGDPKRAGLFGQQLAKVAGRMIVITEGEIDALSVNQALGGTWPVLSVPNGAQGAKAAIKTQLEFLNAYDKVVLCFDSDGPGQDAAAECVELFTPGKAAIANLGGFKDANDVLVNGEPSDLRSAIWEAKVWRPDGVVNLADIKDRISKPLHMGHPYPWEGLNQMLYGYRPGELITWCAGTGVGKSAVVSEIVYDLIGKDVPTGIMFLEEGIDRAGKRLVGLHMNKPIHLSKSEYTEEEFEEAWQATLGKQTVFAYDHFGSLDEDILTNRIRYMVKGLGCQVIVLDHVSMVVSGADLDTDERRMLDHIVTTLVSIAQETGVTIHMVSHLRRPPGQGSHEEGRAVSLSHLRGTQAIAQLSHAVIACERDQQADTVEERNTTTLRVLKNRYAGLTGPACELTYDTETGRLTEVNEGLVAMSEDY
jgi:twinkle protein